MTTTTNDNDNGKEEQDLLCCSIFFLLYISHNYDEISVSQVIRKGQEDIIIYRQIVTTDEDGNIRTKPSTVGTPTKARLQVLGQSGTSSRRQEQDNEGFESERVYTMRLPRSWAFILQALVIWN